MYKGFEMAKILRKCTRLRMLIKYHEEMPRFFGCAYNVPSKRYCVAYLFPLNHIIGCCYMVWHSIRHAEYVYNYLTKFEKKNADKK